MIYPERSTVPGDSTDMRSIQVDRERAVDPLQVTWWSGLQARHLGRIILPAHSRGEEPYGLYALQSVAGEERDEYGQPAGDKPILAQVDTLIFEPPLHGGYTPQPHHTVTICSSMAIRLIRAHRSPEHRLHPHSPEDRRFRELLAHEVACVEPGGTPLVIGTDETAWNVFGTHEDRVAPKHCEVQVSPEGAVRIVDLSPPELATGFEYAR